jgi:hypothetical protein
VLVQWVGLGFALLVPARVINHQRVISITVLSVSQNVGKSQSIHSSECDNYDAEVAQHKRGDQTEHARTDHDPHNGRGVAVWVTRRRRRRMRVRRLGRWRGLGRRLGLPASTPTPTTNAKVLKAVTLQRAT